MKNKILAAMAAVAFVASFNANAAVIEISDQGDANGLWELSTVTGTISDLRESIQQQVWWGDSPLAFIFARDTGFSLGLTFSDEGGPLFAYRGLLNGGDTFAYICFSAPCNPAPVGLSAQEEWTFAVASRVTTSVPEPGTLALLGLGLVGIGLRRRIKAS